jgi:diguanylate cyclase (GGDEF)-like protein
MRTAVKRIYKASVLLLLLTCAAVRAQEYSFRTFGPADGLNNMGIREIYQDRTGFLWVNTDNGVFRYDGDRFEDFGLSGGAPAFTGASFGETPDGALLFGGDFGLDRLQGNRFEAVQGNFKHISWPQGIQAYGESKTLLGTDAGLVEMTLLPGKGGYLLRAIPQPQGTSGASASAVLVDGGTVWYGCGLELCRMEKDGTQVYGRGSGLPRSKLQSIRKDRNGKLWVMADGGAILVLAPGQERFEKPVLPLPASGSANPLSSTSDGQIMIPYGEGLLIQRGTGWIKIDRSSGLRGVIYTALEDRQHSIWVGTSGRGLAQWRGSREWESYSKNSGLVNDYIYEIQPEPDGILWVGSRGGLMRGKPGPSGMKWTSVAALDGYSIHSVRNGPDGALWLGTESHGIARMDPKSGRLDWFQQNQGLAAPTARILLFDHQNRLWAATNAGLYLASPPYRHFERVPELPALPVFSLAEGGDDALWAGGPACLFQFTGGKWKSWTAADGLNRTDIQELHAAADGSLWVGYLGGKMDHLRVLSGKLDVEKDMQPPSGHNLVYFIEQDYQGRLWVGTDRGVNVQEKGHWRHYDESDGLIWDDTDMNAFAALPDGTVWIGTSSGLSRFVSRPRAQPDAQPTVIFTRLVLGAADVTGQDNPSVGIKANSLDVRFSTLDSPRDSNQRFRYRLEGGNSTWTETTQREVQFAKLAPGEYVLEVEVQDDNGEWSTKPADFAFRILTPWYLTWWFLGICGLVPVLAGMGIVRWRVTQLEKHEREVKELMEAHQVINNLAFYDPLTSLPNRRLLLDRLQQSLVVSARNGSLRGLLLIDLDNFKSLNDTLGHSIGDMVLQETARRLAGAVRKSDTAARLGGDEFVVILEDMGGALEAAATQAESIAEKILASISQPYIMVGRECLASASIGITVFGGQGETTNEVLQQADIALYQAKSAGRSSVRFFAPSLQAAVNARAALEGDLHQALKASELKLFFQPQLSGSLLTGAEALIRWQHPERGLLSPMEFIPVAEEAGLILPIGDWVLETACRQIAEWGRNKETELIAVAANISAKQFREPDFVKKVLDALKATGANPCRLKLELTESMFVDNIEDVVAKMTELKTFGLRFSLDDFGTGYSSLSYLKRLPLDELKIDRAFVKDILDDVSSRAIAQTVISLGQALGLNVIAEGVETEEQRLFLEHLGCSNYQRFLYSRPVEVGEFERLMARSTVV